MQRSHLDRLPKDIRCEILHYPISVSDVESLEQAYPELTNEIRDCVQVLDGDEDITLDVDFVLSLSNIRIITPNYPIVINTKQDLQRLSRHKTLQQAAFNLFMLPDTLQLLGSYVNFFFISSKKFSNRCQDCEIDNPRYKFTFFVEINTIIHAIEVSNGGLFLINVDRINLDVLSNYVPICEYRGPLNDFMVQQLVALPCLKHIYFKHDPTIDGVYGYTFLAFAINLLLSNENITEYYISLQLDNKGILGYIISPVIQDLFKLGKVYPHVKVFFPVRASNLKDISVLFPNLTSITLLDDSLALYNLSPTEINYLSRFNVIYITKSNYAIDLMVQQRLDQLPEEIRNRFVFIKPDWLA